VEGAEKLSESEVPMKVVSRVTFAMGRQSGMVTVKWMVSPGVAVVGDTERVGAATTSKVAVT
jgi:hypothetical protein